MLVSIITPAYNSSEFILKTYDSIVQQTHQNWEWLVTDDCSTDDTWNIVQSLAKKDSRIKLQKNNMNYGAAISRNNSIALAKGDFLAFLDSDDLWLPKKLELHLQFMTLSKASLSFTPYILINEQGCHLDKGIDMTLTGQFSYADMLKKNATMGCCTVMVRTSAFTDLSMPLINIGQDYALWLKLLKSGTNAHIFPVPLSKYRIVSNSLSRNKMVKAFKTWQIYRNLEELNLLKASYVFLHYAIKGKFRLNETTVSSSNA